MTDLAARMDGLMATIDPSGEIANAVEKAIRAVPRHHFIPPVGLVAPVRSRPYLIDRDADPGGWWQAVYSNTAIVTQLSDGATPLRELNGDYTSSGSAPSTVADLLNLLDPEPGNRVLEIATGTGWTGALLSHLVGGRGEVTSIEIDPAVAEQAAKNLADAGVAVTLIVGDGALGWPPGAPYDRVHVSCGIRAVPYTWIEQCRPGAVIVLPYCPNFGGNHSLRLVVLPDGTAVGRFPGFASYMMMRSQRPVAPLDPRGPEERHRLRTRVDPRTIAYAPAGADLAMAAMTGLEASHCSATDEHGELFKLWICDPHDPHSWATAVWRPNSVEYDVYQVGHRPVWDEVLNAYFLWVSWGRPGRDRFGMTVGPHGQRVWLDSPDRIVG